MSSNNPFPEPAFPLSYITEAGMVYAHDGMALRDWFAGQALAGLVERTPIEKLNALLLSKNAYKIADAMLKEREGNE